MKVWQVERRKRAKHLIELGGLVVKSGVVDLTGDDRATIYGALLWMAEKLRSERGEQAHGVWAKLGKMAFENSRASVPPNSPLRRALWSGEEDTL
ncbi:MULTISPECIES: conjugal transfer protein TraD [Xanthobacter]|uniref:conjugal transfer protein TraD n=1 Tax=Xanthobacter TaxID=279 RepID=UPI001F299BF7|nr:MULTISPECIES: conjugal transfer protein TraD [unclassified Xanthobacter]